MVSPQYSFKMPRGVADPKQIAMMVRVLDTYARAFGVTDERRREDLATEIVALFGHGYRDEGSLLEALVTREAPTDGGQQH
jgi:hypothetical protein